MQIAGQECHLPGCCIGDCCLERVLSVPAASGLRCQLLLNAAQGAGDGALMVPHRARW
jgi:hypothetical protein